MEEGPATNEVFLALAVEHLRGAVRYARRERRVFFNEANPDTFQLTEGELRKAFASLHRVGRSFRAANPLVDWERVGEVRQDLTHDYADIDREVGWAAATRDVPKLLHRLSRAKRPKSNEGLRGVRAIYGERGRCPLPERHPPLFQRVVFSAS
ncbi:MAG: HepT-like ribonuclease domain-containing protein [Thermoplasmata archaeon]